MAIKHTFVSAIADGSDTGLVRPTNWNADHTIENGSVSYAQIQDVSATDKVLGRVTAGAGDIEEIACTAFARSILDDTNEATFKATVNLEIGTDVLAQQTIGIANDNLVETDMVGIADNDYAKFTTNGLEGRDYTETKQDLSLDKVENYSASEMILMVQVFS